MTFSMIYFSIYLMKLLFAFNRKKIYIIWEFSCLKYMYIGTAACVNLTPNWKLLAFSTERVHLILIEKREFMVLFKITKQVG